MNAKKNLARRGRGWALAGVVLVGLTWSATVRGQAPAAAPRSPWAGYAQGSAWSRYAPAPLPNATQHYTSVAPPSGAGAWAGYAPGRAWTGYAPGNAWVGYRPGRAWRQSPVYGNVPSPSHYQEFGSGRPVPLAKPWLPGSP